MFKFYGIKFQRRIIKFEIKRKSCCKFQTLFLLLNFTRKDEPLNLKIPTFEFKDYSLNDKLYSLEFKD